MDLQREKKTKQYVLEHCKYLTDKRHIVFNTSTSLGATGLETSCYAYMWQFSVLVKCLHQYFSLPPPPVTSCDSTYSALSQRLFRQYVALLDCFLPGCIPCGGLTNISICILQLTTAKILWLKKDKTVCTGSTRLIRNSVVWPNGPLLWQ